MLEGGGEGGDAGLDGFGEGELLPLADQGFLGAEGFGAGVVEDVDAPLGLMPAWLVCGGSNQWAIFVHGRGSSQREALRILPTLSELGLSTLAIWYRNDEGLPPSSSGRYDYGEGEWEDLEAAVRHALDAGASELVLVGYSMGGGM